MCDCHFTDSAYIAFSSPDWQSLVKDKERFESVKNEWFPRDDCPEHAAYDRRTPMLFKEEWKGEGFVGLCSKTYFCYGGETANDKYSCKGLQKSLNKLEFNDYLKVLKTQKSGSGQNRGFRVSNGHMYTYAQDKHGLSYFYPKRKLNNDGISTTCLDI